ncbi:MAG: glycosyltransferase family 2 protein [Prevotellaceae bacterium]|nr:glycosyltransferase family 2 protein [Prevotellaceae bacterium]
MLTITYVTITFNAEATLPFTVDSVLAQDYQAIEHLIIDGASKDNTVKIAEAYKQKSDMRDNGHTVKIISEPDRGIYDAMNKGLRMATGDYVCFLNAGDSLPNGRIVSHIIASLGNIDEQALPAVIYGNTDIVSNERHNLGRRRLSPPEKLTWKSFRNGMLVCHQAFYARTDIAKQFPYDLNYRHSADFDWCIRIMRQAEANQIPFHNTHLILADYLKEGDTTQNHKASLKERFDIMCQYYGKPTTILMHLWFVLRNVTK